MKEINSQQLTAVSGGANTDAGAMFYFAAAYLAGKGAPSFVTKPLINMAKALGVKGFFGTKL